jgi:hypothetical protein
MEDTKKSLEILAKAVSEVGYWRWWTAKLPRAILLEFGGVQLYSRVTREDQPPPGVMAMTFHKPKSICFLDFSRELPGDWHNRLEEDEIDPFVIDRGRFSFNDEAMIDNILRKTLRVNTLHGYPPQKGKLPDAPVSLAFTADKVGVLIAAESLELKTHQGKLPLEQIEKSNARWWEYCKEYWQQKETGNPMPTDYTCEATMPAGAEG